MTTKTTMTTIGLRAFAVFWFLLHAYSVIFACVFLNDPHIGANPADAAVLALFAGGPLAALLVTRWVITGRWRFGPRW